MDFRLIFDTAGTGFYAWDLVGIGLIFVAIGVVRVFAPRIVATYLPWGPGGRSGRIFSWITLLFALSWTLVVTISTVSRYIWIRDALNDGTCTLTQGKNH